MTKLIFSAALALLAFATLAQPPIQPGGDEGPRPVYERHMLGADKVFEPRSATLTAEGKQTLGAIAAKARGLALEVVIAVDYGELSAPRAAAVRQFLLAQGIDAARVYAEGHARPGRPRVEIEVVGSR
jgi:OOP family OmpA-OmpF porin